MRIGALITAALLINACSGRGEDRQYEYEEEMYLSLDGSATLFVNSSVPVLNALRGAAFDAQARLDRAAVREFYSTPVSRVVRVTSSRRRNRVFAHVRLEIPDVRRLGEAPPFAWSTYELVRQGAGLAYRQRVGVPTGATEHVRALGDAIVAFRIHVPSEIVHHNSPAAVQRGNILEWEQPLAERLRGEPVVVDVQMRAESILHRTLRLFGGALAAVAAAFGIVIWWAVHRGVHPSRVQDA
jgi:hypothetical protein